MDLSEQLQGLIEDFIVFLPSLVAAIVVFIASLVISGFAARWVRKWAREKLDDPEIQKLLAMLTRWTVVIVGTLVALDKVDFDVTGFIAGLGIVGFTIGFALQDIARNFVAGILLLIRQPFEIGDAIEAAGYGGTVQDIKVRDTVIRSWDGEEVIIPNADIFTQPILNYTARPTRRRTIAIGLGYEEDVDQAVAALLDAIRGTEGVLAQPEPEIIATELGNSTLQLEARFWLNQETHDVYGTHSAVVQAIKERAEADGIDLPYPIQTVRLEQMG